MKKFKILLPLLLFISSCTSIFENEQGSISASLSDGELIVNNGLDHDIYFFAADQNLLAVINWAPIVTEDNKVGSKQSKTFSQDLVGDYHPGDTVIFHYWDAKISEVRFFEIE